MPTTTIPTATVIDAPVPAPAGSGVGSLAVAALHDALVGALAGTSLSLTDGLLGADLLTPLGLGGVAMRDASIAVTDDGALDVRGTADVLGAAAVGVVLTARAGDEGLALGLDLTLDPAARWGPDALALTGVELQVQLNGASADRRLDGVLRATTLRGPVAFGLGASLGGEPRWDLSVRLEGELVGLLPTWAGESLAALVGPGTPVPDLSLIDAVDVRVALMPTDRRMDAIAVEATIATWAPLPALALDDVALRLAVDHPFDAARRSIVLAAQATVTIGGATVPVRLERAGAGVPVVMAIGGDGAEPAPLGAVLAAFVGSAVVVPEELGNVVVEAVSVDLQPATGAFTVTGRARAGWALPFGGGGLAVAAVELRAERGAAHGGVPAPVATEVTVRGGARLDVADGLAIDAFELAFALDGGAATWSVRGSVDAALFDHPVRLAASLSDGPDGRRFVLTEDTAGDAPAPAVDLDGAGSLTMRGVRVEIVRLSTVAVGEGAVAVGEGAVAPAARLDAAASYAWSVSATGRIDLLDGAVVVDGTVVLHGEPGVLGLALDPTGDGHVADVAVTLPGTEGVGLHLGLGRLELRRSAGGRGSTAAAPVWSLRASPSLWFGGLPSALASLLPASADGALVATLTIDGGVDASVSIAVDRVLPAQPLPLPTLHLVDRDIALGTAALAVPSLAVRWARGGLSVEAAFAVGLPSDLNRTLAGGRNVFRTYDPADPDSLVACRLAATTVGGTPSLSVTPLGSPFVALHVDQPLATDPPDAPRRATFDLGACGRLALELPTIAVQGDVVRVRGGFTQEGLRLPLGPLAWVLRALDLAGLADRLPPTLPLRDLSILDAAGYLDVDALVTLLLELAHAPAGAELPAADALRHTLASLADRVDQLPDRLRPYLHVRVPEHLAFDVAVSVTGAVRGTLSVAAADGTTGRAGTEPLRLLFPGLSVTGPVLNGVSLWSLSIGEILGGAALVATVDADLDQFDVVPLAVALAAPDEVRAALPPTKPLVRRLTADRLTAVIVPEALVALPVFFEDLGVEHHGIEGIEAAAHLRAPHPTIGLAGALRLFTELKDFVTDPDALLDEQALAASGLDLRLVAGPAFLQLPDRLGGRLLGSRTDTFEVSVGEGLSHLLNGLKRLRFDELFRALPDALLHGTVPTAPPVAIGPIGIDGDWRLAAAPGPGRGVELHLAGGASVGPVRLAHGALDVRAGGGGVGLAVAADGGSSSLVGIHVAASLDTGSFAPRAGRTLTLADPAARIVMDGPRWSPATFTVEWWMCPTALADYDQFIAADAAWGAFVFHATASGAVYCGTDVATRLTPAELGPGTLRTGVWQHLAVTYDHGTLTVYRDGTPLASRSGVSAPRPWTGMRLGMPEAGTQVAGGIAELRVWDGARTAADVAATRTRRVAGTEPGLLGHWPLDDLRRDGTLLDNTGRGFTGHVTTGTATVTSSSPGLPCGAPSPAVRVGGDVALSVFGRTVCAGSIDVRPDLAVLAGHLDLFGDHATLSVTGDVIGAVDGGHLDLQGSARVALGGLTLAAADVHVTEQLLRLRGRWFDTFDTDLKVDGTLGRMNVIGSITGGSSIEVTFPAQYVPTPVGPRKLCDRFVLSTSFDVDLDVRADEATGLYLGGTVDVRVGSTTLTVRPRIRIVPASAAAFVQLIADELQANARRVFQLLFPDAAAWLGGVLGGTIGWVRSAWDDTVGVFRDVFGRTATDVAALLDHAAFGAADFGEVIKRLTPSPLAFAKAFADAGVDVARAAESAFTAFEAAFRRDPFTQARSVAAILCKSYGADTVGGTIRRRFGLTNKQSVQILTEYGYAIGAIARTARDVFRMGVRETAAALSDIGVAAADTLAGLSAAWPEVQAAALRPVLEAAGYGRTVLDDLYRTFRLTAG